MYSGLRMHRKMWDSMPIFKALLKVISEERAEVLLSHGTGTEYILIILSLSYERLVPFRSCILPEIKNKCDKLSPNASRCNCICASEVLVTSPTAMLDTMKLWELWELTEKHNFIQIMLFCGSVRILSGWLRHERDFRGLVIYGTLAHWIWLES